MTEVEVLDVRYPNAWLAGHIRGSRHVPVDDLFDHLHELDRARLIVTVCRSGQRSATAAVLLSDEGFVVESLDGGMLAWATQGLALVASDEGSGTVAELEEPPDDRPLAMQRLQNEFLFAVQAHFGDREASEKEVRAFLKDRLIAEGETPEEAEQPLDDEGS